MPSHLLNFARRPVTAFALAFTSCLVGACDSGSNEASTSGSDVSVSCDDLDDWDPAWADFEDEVLALSNEAREKGHDCDSEGSFGPAAPLTMEPRLRCAARAHSAYMAEHGEFDHIQARTGSDPFDRIADTGYQFSAAGENIALGQRTPAEVVAGWLDSDGHCANIMSPDFRELGVGYALGSGAPIGSSEAAYWTQVFGSER